MSPKEKKKLAREHLDRALGVIDADEIDGVHWLFAALEAAVDSLASDHGASTGPSHHQRLRAAQQLADQGSSRTTPPRSSSFSTTLARKPSTRGRSWTCAVGSSRTSRCV
jgi:hypothetical protein